MCGIVGYIGEHQASEILLDGLTKLEYRGYDSAGVAVRNDDNVISVVKTKGRIKYLKANNVDVIHCHTEFGLGKAGLRAAKILKIPAICTTHTMWTDFYKYYLAFGKLISPKIINGIMKKYYVNF